MCWKTNFKYAKSEILIPRIRHLGDRSGRKRGPIWTERGPIWTERGPIWTDKGTDLDGKGTDLDGPKFNCFTT